LRAMAGLEGLCLGLRTDKTRGLSRDEDVLDGHVTLEDVQQMLEAQKTAATSSLVDYQHRQSSTETCVDQPEPPVPGLLSRRSTMLSLNFRRGGQPFRDRKKAFGENRIPVRKAKNIFQLMWMVLQDKVLVCSRIYRVLTKLDSFVRGSCDLAGAWTLSIIPPWLYQ
jgi:P-type Ca2+ transporter type 2C